MRGAIHHSRSALVRDAAGPSVFSSPDFNDLPGKARLSQRAGRDDLPVVQGCVGSPSWSRSSRRPRSRAATRPYQSPFRTTPPAAFPVSGPPLAAPPAPSRLSPGPLAAPPAPFPLSRTPLSAPQAPFPLSEMPLSAPKMPFPKGKVSLSGTPSAIHFSQTSLTTTSYP